MQLVIWPFKKTLVLCSRPASWKGEERKYAEYKCLEDLGFVFLFDMRAQLPLTLARGKKEKKNLEGKRCFGWSWQSQIQDFHCNPYFRIVLVER